MGSHHELIVEISVHGISFHVVEVSGVLLIILRGYRWLKVDWLVVVLVGSRVDQAGNTHMHLE